MALRLCEALEVFWDVRGLYSEGRTFLEQTLAGRKGVTVPQRARALSAAAGFAFAQSDYDRAEELCQESLVLYRELGDTRGIAYSLQGLALIAPKKGSHIETTCSLLEESLALYRKLDDKKAIAWSLVSLADFTSFQGEYSRGRALYEESLAMGRVMGDNLCIAFSLEGLADVAGVQGDPAWAARLWGAAEALREARGTPLQPVYSTDYEQSVATARTRLGEKAFVAAWAEGRMMTPEQVLVAQGQPLLPN